MEMYFFQSIEATVLFKGWQTKSTTQYAFTCIAVIVMGVIYELMKVWRIQLDAYLKKKFCNCHCRPDEETALINDPSKSNQKAFKFPLWIQLIRATVHMIHFTLSYWLMLIAMIYNTGIFVSVILGVGLGYLISGSMSVGASCCPDKN
eukprot:m.6447 g.6447  ORF g.6447 m.6447 type:complete len:148 (-) comp2597_c0_seq1:197-640(-)